jgi:hypothetical protein
VKSTALSQLLRLDLHTELYEVTEVCSSSVIGGRTYTERNIDSIRRYYFVSLNGPKIYDLLIVNFMLFDMKLITLAVNFKELFFSHYAS